MQKRSHFDSEEWHSRRRNSFELTFSLESGPPGALGLRLCNETAQGRLAPVWISGFFICFGPWAGTINGGKHYLSLVHVPVTTHETDVMRYVTVPRSRVYLYCLLKYNIALCAIIFVCPMVHVHNATRSPVVFSSTVQCDEKRTCAHRVYTCAHEPQRMYVRRSSVRDQFLPCDASRVPGHVPMHVPTQGQAARNAL